MSWIRVSIAAFVLAFVVPFSCGTTALAAGKDKSSDSADDAVFVPPEIGTPSDRMGAGTRGTTLDHDSALLLLLIPEGGGLTTLASPPLVWRLGRGHRGDLVVGLKPIGAPGTETLISGPFPPGDYGLNLVRSNVQLEPDQIYEWQVTLLAQNSGDFVGQAKGLIERVPDQMKSDDPAGAGLWFDALSQMLDISLSGRALAADPARLERLLSSAGVTN